uniref:NR LBD domain-containing protein n=1 Tax=Elaeophora elaphi TaxID=1147741 RepID=A0A0R3RJ38_9BILA
LQTLTKCSSPTNWCLSELVQASVILAQTHVLCSFVLGNGTVNPNGHTDSCKVVDDQKSGSSREIELLLECIDQLKKSKLNTDMQRPGEQEMQKDFLEVQNDCDGITSTTFETEEASLPEKGSQNNCIEKRSVQNCHTVSSLYTFDNRFGYVDFTQRAQDGFARTHKIHEFSWEDQGYSCVDELYNEMADILDKKITLIQNLTYSTMGTYSDVDTSKYRNAIWMYIQSLYGKTLFFVTSYVETIAISDHLILMNKLLILKTLKGAIAGIRHDDYNYAEVNVMLNRKMKTFIKTTCCYPHEMTDSLRQSVMIDFKSSEKVHVLLIVMEARLQAELIYFFRALVKLNNSSTIA